MTCTGLPDNIGAEERTHDPLKLRYLFSIIWTNVGKDAAHAKAEQILVESRMTAQAAKAAGAQLVETGPRIPLRRKAVAHVERQEARGKLRYVERFRSAFDEFTASTGAVEEDAIGGRCGSPGSSNLSQSRESMISGIRSCMNVMWNEISMSNLD